MRNLFFITFCLICISCGPSNSEFGILGFSKPEAPHIGKISPAKYRDIAFRLDTLFATMAGKNGFNGAVIVAKDAEIIYQKAFGFADKKNNIPLTDTTSFQLASVSKVITATAVMLLVEKGLIKLDDSFASYFPEFPYEKITIKHLLSHRSGLPNYLYFLNDIVTSKNRVLTNKEVLDLMIEKKPGLYLQPNKAFNYCNTNYALLALLIEKVSQKTFSNFLREEIFLPLGMKHSGTILSLDIFEKSISKPYDNRWKIIETEASDYVVGDKSIYSTPYDMFLFSEALYQGKLLNPESQALAYTALSREKKLSNYGLGWRMKDFKDDQKKEVFHNGWWHGYRTAFHRRLSDKITIVVLSNQLNRSAYQTYKIYRAIDADTLLNDEADEE
jgi:CubicO group peptidase (beta-lactamase class C family)